MNKKCKQSFHVLDLACGVGRVRIAVARRVSAPCIRYTGLDRNTHRLERVEQILRALEPKARPEASETPAASAFAEHAEGLEKRLQERFVRTDLDLNDPGNLGRQLDRLVGRERFNEIHVHLLHPGVHGAQATGPQVLRTVGKYLRPGGRIYHLFQHSSPFFEFKPEFLQIPRGGGCPLPGSRGDAISRNEARFREGARKGRLVLDKCGHRWQKWQEPAEAGAAGTYFNFWITRHFAGSEPNRRTAETYQKLALQYSGFSSYATHFVIIRKAHRKRRGASLHYCGETPSAPGQDPAPRASASSCSSCHK